MLNQFLDTVFSWGLSRSPSGALRHLGLLLTLSLALTPFGTVRAQANELQPSQAVASSTQRFLEDGIYLYGESSQPEQIGKAYMVFEVKQGEVIGAFYMPRSSFDCFSGSAKANQLALNIVETYSRETYPYSIGLDSTSVVAASKGGGADTDIKLEGFHPISKISQNDYRILEVCKGDYQ